jgi:hypothetical protein
MKKLLLACLLFSGWGMAQNISFNDKTIEKVVLSTYDLDKNGLINIDEADRIFDLLIFGQELTSLSDLRNFRNLFSLRLDNNTIYEIDVSNLYNLKKLEINSPINLKKVITNDINIESISIHCEQSKTEINSFTVDFTKNVNLNYLYCNRLTNEIINQNIDLTKNINLEEIQLYDVKNIDLRNNVNLKKVRIISNNLLYTDLDISNNKNLTDINLSGYNLSTFDNSLYKNLDKLYLSGCVNIKTYDYSVNQNLTELTLDSVVDQRFNVKNNNKLSLFSVLQNYALDNLEISTLKNLHSLTIFSKALKKLELKGLDSLQFLGGLVQDTILDLSNNKMLNYFSINCPNIKELNFENNPKIKFINGYYPNLVFLNIKNGFKNPVYILNLPFNGLKYICVDDSELDYIDSLIKSVNKSNVEFNTYCSFIPAGEYNTISNNIMFNENGNCSVKSVGIPYTKFGIKDQNGVGYSVTDKQGIVQFHKQKGIYTINPLVEITNYFKISPQSVNFNLNDNSGHDTTINFCISPNGIHKDLEVIVSPYGPARPGFDATYLVTYKNKGNQTLSGDINVTYNEDVLDFVSSTMSSHSNGNVSSTFSDLKPFEVRVDTLVLNVNSPIETPAVNINDTLNFNATINPTNEDETPTDNVFELNQRVVGAYDPNLITCLQGNELKPTEIGKTLYYTIEFENTGNYPAENIVVVEEIDPTKYDLNSLQILNTSHPMKFRVEGNKVEYYFDKIQLGEHKHGNILLKLNSNDALIEGSEVTKQANIYFDYNAPVQTNNEKTVYRDLKASIADLKEDVSISVFPNPGKGNVNVRSATNIKSIEVYDVNGRLLQTKVVSSIQTEINLSDEITGVYFIKVTTEEGANVIKYQKD